MHSIARQSNTFRPPKNCRLATMHTRHRQAEYTYGATYGGVLSNPMHFGTDGYCLALGTVHLRITTGLITRREAAAPSTTNAIHMTNIYK